MHRFASLGLHKKMGRHGHEHGGGIEIGSFPDVGRIVTRKNDSRPKILSRPGQRTNTFSFGGGTVNQLSLFNIFHQILIQVLELQGQLIITLIPNHQAHNRLPVQPLLNLKETKLSLF